MSDKPVKILSRLLLSMFSAEEMRRLIRYNFPEEMLHALPGPTAPVADLADAISAAILDRNALSQLWPRLAEERPHRRTEIEGARARIEAHEPAPRPDSPPRPVEGGVGSDRAAAPASRVPSAPPDELIETLAEAYPDVRDARVVWVRAGGKTSDVENVPRPRDLWQRLWLQSTQGAAVRPAALLRAVLQDLPNNEVLREHLERAERGSL